MEHDIDAVVVGVGSGGTLTGLGRFLRQGLAEDRDGARRSGRLGARALDQDRQDDEAGSWTVEGIGEDFVPPNCDLSLGQEGLFDPRPASMLAAARDLLRPGRHLSPARRPAPCSRPRCVIAASRGEPKRVVTFVCDSGNKYLSKVFDDFWLASKAGPRSQSTATVRDLVVNRASRGRHGRRAARTTLCARPMARMRARRRFAASCDRRRADRRHRRRERSAAPCSRTTARTRPSTARVKDVMATRLRHDFRPTRRSATWLPLFRKNYVAIVMDGDAFVGLSPASI